MKRIILVIGAKGMLGRDLMGILPSSLPNDEIFGWDIEEIDIQEEENTLFKIEKLRSDVVINLAAYTDVDVCESDEEKTFAINAEGARHAALAALKCGRRWSI